MSDTPEQPKPIEVKAHAAPILSQEGLKTIIVAAGTYFVVTYVKSDQAQMAILPAVAVVATMVVSACQRLKTWSVLKKLANTVDDSIAIVGKKK